MWNTTSSEPPTSVALISLSGVVFGLGLISNLAVALLLCSQRSSVNRLLVSLCLSDLLVCTASTPMVVVGPTLNGIGVCKIAAFAQEVPIAASTLSLSMLALERYSAIRPMCLFTRLRRLMAGVVWIAAALSSAPLFGAKCDEQQIYTYFFRTLLLFSQLVMVYLLPCVTLAVCHVTVSYKLCDISLSAAAARGEVPLPLPLLRHPKHVIIVASVAHDGPSKMVPYGDEGSSGDDSKIKADLLNRCQVPRASPHYRRKHKVVQRVADRTQPCFRRPQSLRSRRQLAVLLVVQVLLFATCWLPYVCVAMCAQLGYVTEAILPYTRLLGHAHSALNPIVYWFLNRHTLPWPKSRLLRKLGTFQLQRAPPVNAPSSTNEAALGAFHPRYATVRAQPVTRVPRRRRRR